MSQEAHGALGGIEFRTSTYGNIVGRRSITPHRRTQLQLTHRAQMSEAAAAWRALSREDQQKWEAIAKYPSTGRMTFIAGYLKLYKFQYPVNPQPIVNSEFDLPYDISIFKTFPAQKAIQIQWKCKTTHFTIANVSIQRTTSSRETPPKPRFLWHTWVYCPETLLLIPLEYKAPYVWIQMETIDYPSGQKVATIQQRLKVTW